MTASITVDDRSVIEGLNRLLASGANPQPWLSIIGNNMKETTRLRFISGQTPSGQPWAPLSPVTLARRRQGGRGAQPLRDTNRLMSSITSRTGANYVEVGTNVVYARMQQQGAARGAFGRTRRGAPIPWGDVPGRAYLGLSIEDRASALEIFAEAAGVSR